jgi:hypothetical protein
LAYTISTSGSQGLESSRLCAPQTTQIFVIVVVVVVVVVFIVVIGAGIAQWV